MTSARAAASRFDLRLAFAMGMRELRSGAGGLAVFVLCIALGVASVAAIGSLLPLSTRRWPGRAGF